MKSNKREGNRKELYDIHGFDVKFAGHLVRLSYECEMILAEHDLDLQRHKEHVKAVRRGEVKEQDIRDWFSEKEKQLQKLYETSTLPHSPDEAKIKQLLLDILEHHFGSLENCVSNLEKEKEMLKSISEILYKGGY